MIRNLRYICCMVIAFATLFFSGCSTVTISQRILVETMGVDFDGSGYTLTLVTYKPTNENQQSANSTEVYKGKGNTLSEAIADASPVSGKQLFFDNNRVLLLGGGAAGKAIVSIADFMLRDPRMSPLCLVAATSGRAEDMLNSEKSGETLSQQYIASMLRESVKTGEADKITLLEVMKDLKDDCRDAVIPLIKAEEGNMLPDGCICYSGNLPSLTLGREETRMLNLLSDSGGRVQLSLGEEGKKFSVTVIDSRSSISVSKDVSRADVTLDVTVTSSEMFGVAPDQLRLLAQRKLYEECISVMKKLRAVGSDPLCIAAHFRQSCAMLLLDRGEEPKNAFENAALWITVNVSVAANHR